jgi:hypothetical protein
LSGDPQLPFGLRVEGFNLLVRDGPVLNGTSWRGSIESLELEIILNKPIGHAAVNRGTTADCGGYPAISILVGIYKACRFAWAQSESTRVRSQVGAKTHGTGVVELAVQNIVMGVLQLVMVTTFEEDHGETSFAQLFGYDSTPRPGTNNYRIYFV